MTDRASMSTEAMDTAMQKLRLSVQPGLAPLYGFTPAEAAALLARLSDEPGAEERAFSWGWRIAANWAKRDDLAADIGSPAYLAEMRAALTKEGGL